MSFDAEFDLDYTKVVNYLNGRITLDETEKNKCLQELSILGNLPGEYTTISSEIIDFHNNKIVALNKSLSKTANVISGITIIQNLPNDSKNVLFDFYQTYVKDCSTFLGISSDNVRKKYFMRQLVSNSNEMIPYVSNLMNDVSMTSEQCNCVASLICTKYQAKQDTMSFNHVLLER